MEFTNGRIDVMLDIETLGRKSDSTIFQISAIAFDIDTGEYIDTFDMCADVSTEEIKVDGSTLKWWLQTNKELLTELLSKSTCTPTNLLFAFHSWLMELTADYSMDAIYLWGNGILFDNRMIKYQLEALGLEYPIFFRNDRDLRTLVDLAATKKNMTPKQLQAEFENGFISPLVKHNALDDVKYQITVAIACRNILLMEVD